MKRMEQSISRISYELNHAELRTAIDEWISKRGAVLTPLSVIDPRLDDNDKLVGVTVITDHEGQAKEAPLPNSASGDRDPQPRGPAR